MMCRHLPPVLAKPCHINQHFTTTRTVPTALRYKGKEEYTNWLCPDCLPLRHEVRSHAAGRFWLYFTDFVFGGLFAFGSVFDVSGPCVPGCLSNNWEALDHLSSSCQTPTAMHEYLAHPKCSVSTINSSLPVVFIASGSIA